MQEDHEQTRHRLRWLQILTILFGPTLIGILFGFGGRLCTAITGAVENAMLHQTPQLQGPALATSEGIWGSIILIAIWQTRPWWSAYSPRINYRNESDGARPLPKVLRRLMAWLDGRKEWQRYAIVLTAAAALTMGVKNCALFAQIGGVSSGAIGATLVIGPLAVSALSQMWEGRPFRALSSSLVAAAGVYLVAVYVTGGSSFPLVGTMYALAAAGLRGLSIPVTRMLIGPGAQGHRGNALIALVGVFLNLLLVLISQAHLGTTWDNPGAALAAALVSSLDVLRTPWESPTVILAIVGVSLIATVGPSICDLNCRVRVADWQYALVYASAPILSSLISIFALHQGMSWLQLVGISAIAVAVILSSAKKPRAQRAKASVKSDHPGMSPLVAEPLINDPTQP